MWTVHQIVLGLLARIGTLPGARSDTHGTSNRFTDRDTVWCRAVGSVLAYQAHAYRRLQTDSMHENNIMQGVQISRRQFFVCYRPSCQTSLSSQHESLAVRVSPAQGKLAEGEGGEGEEGVGCRNEMTKNNNKKKNNQKKKKKKNR